MAIKIDNKEFLSYEEQVLENKKKILEIITEVNAKLVEIDDKVKDTLLVDYALSGITTFPLSSVLPNQGELVVGDLVIGIDGYIAKVIGIGAISVDITQSAPVLDYMNALNVAFDGVGTDYLYLNTDVQNALKQLDSVVKVHFNTLSAHANNKTNPHQVTKAQLGLGNVDNTADADKPLSGPQGLALSTVSQNIDTHKNNKSNPHQVTKAQVGLGNVDNTSDNNKPVSYPQGVAIGEVSTALETHKDDTDNPHAVTKAHVGLSNVDNTSDLNKPVSTATQTALDAKANKVQEAWITPTLVNGWVRFGESYNQIGYYKDNFGVVRLRGLIKEGTMGQTIFVLPVSHRPSKIVHFVVYSNSGFGVIYVDTAGNVSNTSGYGSNAALSLENISFRV